MKKLKKHKWIAAMLSMSLVLNAALQPSLAFIVTQSIPALNVFKPYKTVEGDLVISKTVEHPFGGEYVIPENIEFDFEIALGDFYAGYTLETSQGETTADENGVITLAVKPDEPVGIEGIDDGVQVTVTELQTENDGFEISGEVSQTAVISSEEQTVLEFVNVYTPEPVKADSIDAEGDKTLEGRQWQEGDSFSFFLEKKSSEDEWQTLGTVDVVYDEENTEFNHITFNDILHELVFDTVGEYSFRITEENGGLENIFYDESENLFNVTVTDEDMDGFLEISNVTTDGSVAIAHYEETDGYYIGFSFVNLYEETITTTTTTTTTTEISTTTTTETTTTTSDTTTSTSTSTSASTLTSTSTSTTTTTTSTTETTTTTTTTTTDTVIVDIYVKEGDIEVKEGYYFSHDYREFNKGQITVLKMTYLWSDGSETTEEIDTTAEDSPVNFNGQTPDLAYYEENTSFKYEGIQAYYRVSDEENIALKYEDGTPVTVTAYIGVKGDADLNNVVDPVDATRVLVYYSYHSMGMITQLCVNPNIPEITPELENLAALLADTDTDEYSPDNWKLTKEDRILDPVDSTYILRYYSYHSMLPAYHGKDAWKIWLKVVFERTTILGGETAEIPE